MDFSMEYKLDIYQKQEYEKIPPSIIFPMLFIAGAISVSELPGYNFIVQGVGALAFLSFVMGAVRTGFKWSGELTFFLLFYIWGILTKFVVIQPFFYNERVRTLIQLLLAVWMLSNYVKNTRCANKLLFSVFCGVFIISFAAVLTGDYARAEDIEGESTRLAGLTLNSNLFSITIVYGVMILLNMFSRVKKLFTKLIIISMIILGINFVFASGSRKGLIGLGIVLILWYILTYGKQIGRNPKVSLISLTLLFLFSGYTVYKAQNSFLIERFVKESAKVSMVTTEGSAGLRMAMIEKGIQLIKEHPIMGVGLDQFRVVSGYGLYSHNNYIEDIFYNWYFGWFFIFFNISFICL